MVVTELTLPLCPPAVTVHAYGPPTPSAVGHVMVENEPFAGAAVTKHVNVGREYNDGISAVPYAIVMLAASSPHTGLELCGPKL